MQMGLRRRGSFENDVFEDEFQFYACPFFPFLNLAAGAHFS